MNGGIVFDRVYGEVELPPVAARLASTRPLDRLRHVKQLGGCEYVYPSATHTRYEHSLGVCHLAGVLAEHLRAQRPDLVDARDVLCVQVAGLLHDVGHGPFSHLFEEAVGDGWSHEEMGLRLIEERLEAEVSEEELSVADWRFVRLLVTGLAADAPWPAAAVAPRPASKRFLCDIVHNRASGLDVDKLDYLARDALAVLGQTHLGDAPRLVRAARLVDAPAGGAPVLAFHEGAALAVAQVYALRARLHRQVYQHRAVAVVEGLLKDVLRGLPLRAWCADLDVFAKLTDARVLQEAAAHAPALHARLFVRPWCARVSGTGVLRTLPACARCACATAIEDAFCAACGASTAARPGVLEEGLLVPPECTVTEEEASRDVGRLLGRADVRVHLVDVHEGAPVPTVDPHGRTWRAFDALRGVRFRARDGALVQLRGEESGGRHSRTAHCYLPPGSTEEELRDAATAFAAWVRSVGHLAEA